MTYYCDDIEVLDLEPMSPKDLAEALLAGTDGMEYAAEAAVRLIVDHQLLLGWAELRAATVGFTLADDTIWASIDWERLPLDAPASPSELGVLEIARSLAGIPGERSLADLLAGLDATDIERVLTAIRFAGAGPSDADEIGWRNGVGS